MKIFFVFVCLFHFALPLQAGEDNASVWAHSHNTSMRLIAGSPLKGSIAHNSPVLRAGIEIKLAPNFKTYWRTPGESGVAPQISFDGSQNLKSAEVLFPAPHIFKDKTGTAIGYKNHVIWPIHAQAQDATKPVILNIKFDYGVCEKICIPASGTAKIALGLKKSTEFDTQISASEAHVPEKLNLGEGKGISITKVSETVVENNHATFIVDVAGSEFVDILPEAKPDSWYLEAQPINSKGSQFKITVFDPQSARHAVPCDISLTALQGSKGIEVPIRLAGCLDKGE